VADIFAALEDEIQRQRKVVDQNYVLLAEIACLTVHIDADVDAYRLKAGQSFAILHSCLLAGFLEVEAPVRQALAACRAEFLVNKRAFMDFLIRTLGRLNEFLAPIAECAFPSVAVYLHT
jgi:hypothetical protein